MRVQLFLASTLFGAATLAAALDAGRFPAADRRLLLVSTNTATPETTPALDAMAGFARLRGRFDRVLSWNDTIRPLHPSGWSPRAEELPLWERQLRASWGLADSEVTLIVESLQVNPAQALCRLFPSAPIDVYADGLMSYGPTRNAIDPLIGTRVRRLLHLDLLPGLRPLLLTEFGVRAEVVPQSAFTDVLAEVAAEAPPLAVATDPSREGGPALLLGQYLAALGILSDAEERGLYARMLRGAVALGHRTLVFAPHPATAGARYEELWRAADALDVRLTVLTEPVLAEVLFQRLRPALVVGCFSTALLTASVCYGLPVAHSGTDLLLERLTPYQNSNRIPVTLVDAALPALGDGAAVERWSVPDARKVAAELTDLTHTVGYLMQAQRYPGLRETARRYLDERLDERTRRYVKRRRLTALGLPGGVPARLAFLPRHRTVRYAARRVRSLSRALQS